MQKLVVRLVSRLVVVINIVIVIRKIRKIDIRDINSRRRGRVPDKPVSTNTWKKARERRDQLKTKNTKKKGTKNKK